MGKKRVLLFLIILILLFPEVLQARGEGVIQELIEVYQENIRLEEQLLNRLIFTLAEPNKQFVTFEKGWGHKLIMRDNLGNLWIFKENGKGIKAVGVYHLFKLFGISTPPIFKIDLPINGKIVTGTVQKLIEDVVDLDKRSPTTLSQEALQQLLKIHILDWLIANCDSVGENFLLKFDEVKNVENIFRIDNDSAFVMFGEDKLRTDYTAPWLLNAEENYYYLLWKAHKENKINLDFNKQYQFAIFISKFPDEMFLEILNDAISFSFLNDRKTRLKSLSEYKKAIVTRKRNLPKDFKNFYKNLAQKRGLTLSLSEEKIDNLFIERLYKKLKKDNKNLRVKIKILSKSKKPKQENIKVIASQRAWKVIYWFIVNHKIQFVQENKNILKSLDLPTAQHLFEISLKEKFCLPDVFDSLIKELEGIYEETADENEKKAIILYIEELRSIKKGNRKLNSLKRIVISQEEKEK